MSFVLDVCLLVILLAAVALYARRSIFGALTGVTALAVAATAAALLTGTVSPAAESAVTAPLVERAAANELADMYSAPHLSSGRQTVAALPLGELVERQPEAYLQLLDEYSVAPQEVAAAYAASPSAETVLLALTGARSAAMAQSLVFMVLTAVFTLVLRLIAQRVEQNFPPAARYRGLRRLAPGALGALAGLVALWAVVAVLDWLVPTVQGQIWFLSEEMLDGADWFCLLRRTDVFLYIV